MNNPKISIIIPVKNSEKYIEDCLDSVVNQTYKNIEVIVVDNGCTDNTMKIVEHFKRGLYNIKDIRYTFGGTGGARNAGIRIASGDFLMFVDSDDMLAYDLLSRIVEETDFSKYNTVVFGAMAFGDAEVKKDYIDKRNEEFRLPDIERMYGSSEEAESISATAWGKLFNRYFIKVNDIWFPEMSMAEDFAFYWSYMMRVNGLIRVLPIYGYLYRLHKDSMTGDCTKDWCKSCYNLQAVEFLIKQVAKRRHSFTNNTARLKRLISKMGWWTRLNSPYEYRDKVFDWETVQIKHLAEISDNYDTVKETVEA